MPALRHSQCIPWRASATRDAVQGLVCPLNLVWTLPPMELYVLCDPHTAFRGGCAQEHASHVSAPLKWAHIKFRDSSCEDVTAHGYVPNAARSGYPRSSGRKFDVVSPGVCLGSGHLSYRSPHECRRLSCPMTFHLTFCASGSLRLGHGIAIDIGRCFAFASDVKRSFYLGMSGTAFGIFLCSELAGQYRNPLFDRLSRLRTQEYSMMVRLKTRNTCFDAVFEHLTVSSMCTADICRTGKSRTIDHLPVYVLPISLSSDMRHRLP